MLFDNCQECRIKSTAVSALNKDELEFLSRNCTPGIFRRGDPILKEGDPSRYIVYIRDGFAKQFKKSSRGEEQIINVVKKGSYVGLHNIIKTSCVNYISAKAIKDVSACFISRECFDELLRRNGEFASRVISCICEDEVLFINRLLNNQQQQLYGRLADALLYFLHVVYGENPFVLDLTKTELALFIGSSRESVTRALKQLQDSGIIKSERKTICILDEEKLKQLRKKG